MIIHSEVSHTRGFTSCSLYEGYREQMMAVFPSWISLGTTVMPGGDK
ncbi:MAG: hypothetical protein LLF80_09750 [Porphyromonadaceae bacterium]|nr:hypothetical protein [Porphyromonadaceae bacterium]